MPEPMTDARLDEISAIAAAATPGPWEAAAHWHHEIGCRCLSCHVTTGWIVDHPHTLLCEETPESQATSDTCDTTVLKYEDAVLAAESRTAVPELVAEVRRLRAELDETQDLLANKVGQELLDRTLLKSARPVDGHFEIDLVPARELLLLWCASVREMLDRHGAENYAECEITTTGRAGAVSMDIQDGQHNTDAYTLTLQRRYRPTAHDLRRRAEKERDDALAEVERLRAELAAKEA